jgi:hypothetical protein
MEYNMSINELKALLATEAYKATSYPCHSVTGFEDLGDYGEIKTLFDDLLTELGRPPSQKEYVTAGTARAKEFFKPNTIAGRNSVHNVRKNGKTKQLSFTWNSELVTAVQKRLSRTYPSFLVEYSTIIMLKELYPTFKLAANPYIDGIFGADMVVASKENNKVFYIHVIRNTATSRQYLKDKATRKGYCVDVFGKNKYFTRNWDKSHVELAYDTYESAHTDNINGNFIMKPSYIKEIIAKEIASPAGSTDAFNNKNQISIFHTWLIDNKIDSKGLTGAWIVS